MTSLWKKTKKGAGALKSAASKEVSKLKIKADISKARKQRKALQMSWGPQLFDLLRAQGNQMISSATATALFQQVQTDIQALDQVISGNLAVLAEEYDDTSLMDWSYTARSEGCLEDAAGSTSALDTGMPKIVHSAVPQEAREAKDEELREDDYQDALLIQDLHSPETIQDFATSEPPKWLPRNTLLDGTKNPLVDVADPLWHIAALELFLLLSPELRASSIDAFQNKEQAAKRAKGRPTVAASPEQPKSGVLKVVIHSAKGLLNTRLNPYCVCSLTSAPKLKARTPVMKRSSTPVWEQLVKFTTADANKDHLICKVKHWSAVGANRELGRVLVPITKLVSGGLISKHAFSLDTVSQGSASKLQKQPSLRERTEQQQSQSQQMLLLTVQLSLHPDFAKHQLTTEQVLHGLVRPHFGLSSQDLKLLLLGLQAHHLPSSGTEPTPQDGVRAAGFPTLLQRLDLLQHHLQGYDAFCDLVDEAFELLSADERRKWQKQRAKHKKKQAKRTQQNKQLKDSKSLKPSQAQTRLWPQKYRSWMKRQVALVALAIHWHVEAVAAVCGADIPWLGIEGWEEPMNCVNMDVQASRHAHELLEMLKLRDGSALVQLAALRTDITLVAQMHARTVGRGCHCQGSDLCFPPELVARLCGPLLNCVLPGTMSTEILPCGLHIRWPDIAKVARWPGLEESSHGVQFARVLLDLAHRQAKTANASILTSDDFLFRSAELALRDCSRAVDDSKPHVGPEFVSVRASLCCSLICDELRSYLFQPTEAVAPAMAIVCHLLRIQHCPREDTIAVMNYLCRCSARAFYATLREELAADAEDEMLEAKANSLLLAEGLSVISFLEHDECADDRAMWELNERRWMDLALDLDAALDAESQLYKRLLAYATGEAGRATGVGAATLSEVQDDSKSDDSKSDDSESECSEEEQELAVATSSWYEDVPEETQVRGPLVARGKLPIPASLAIIELALCFRAHVQGFLRFHKPRLIDTWALPDDFLACIYPIKKVQTAFITHAWIVGDGDKVKGLRLLVPALPRLDVLLNGLLLAWARKQKHRCDDMMRRCVEGDQFKPIRQEQLGDAADDNPRLRGQQQAEIRAQVLARDDGYCGTSVYDAMTILYALKDHLQRFLSLTAPFGLQSCGELATTLASAAATYCHGIVHSCGQPELLPKPKGIQRQNSTSGLPQALLSAVKRTKVSALPTDVSRGAVGSAMLQECPALARELQQGEHVEYVISNSKAGRALGVYIDKHLTSDPLRKSLLLTNLRLINVKQSKIRDSVSRDEILRLRIDYLGPLKFSQLVVGMIDGKTKTFGVARHDTAIWIHKVLRLALEHKGGVLLDNAEVLEQRAKKERRAHNASKLQMFNLQDDEADTNNLASLCCRLASAMECQRLVDELLNELQAHQSSLVEKARRSPLAPLLKRTLTTKHAQRFGKEGDKRWARAWELVESAGSCFALMCGRVAARAVCVDIREDFLDRLYMPTPLETRLRGGKLQQSIDDLMQALFLMVPDSAFSAVCTGVLLQLCKAFRLVICDRVHEQGLKAKDARDIFDDDGACLMELFAAEVDADTLARCDSETRAAVRCVFPA